MIFFGIFHRIFKHVKIIFLNIFFSFYGTFQKPNITLMLVITKHFIEDLVYFQERTSEILNILTSLKLQNFKWYNKIVLIKVIMTRLDYGNHYWKEIFKSKLPTLFTEKVRQRIRINERISY